MMISAYSILSLSICSALDGTKGMPLRTQRPGVAALMTKSRLLTTASRKPSCQPRPSRSPAAPKLALASLLLLSSVLSLSASSSFGPGAVAVQLEYFNYTLMAHNSHLSICLQHPQAAPAGPATSCSLRPKELHWHWNPSAAATFHNFGYFSNSYLLLSLRPLHCLQVNLHWPAVRCKPPHQPLSISAKTLPFRLAKCRVYAKGLIVTAKADSISFANFSFIRLYITNSILLLL